MAIPVVPDLPAPPILGTDFDEDFSRKTDALYMAYGPWIAALNAFAAALVAEAASVIAGVASINGKTGPLTGFTENTVAQTLTNKTLTAPAITDPVLTGTLTEDVYTIVDGASVDINPANGSEQFWTLGANRTPTAANMQNGQSITLYIADGTSYAVTWSTIGVVWGGGIAPILPATGYATIVLTKAGGVVRGYQAPDTLS